MRPVLILLLLSLSSFSLCEKKKIIYLIRHGETNFNTDPVPRVRGRINVPLNEEGIAHCKAAGDFLANENIGKIYYSAIPRAKQSAECVRDHHNGPVEMIEFVVALVKSDGSRSTVSLRKPLLPKTATRKPEIVGVSAMAFVADRPFPGTTMLIPMATLPSSG